MSNIGKGRLVFDATAAADSDNVGAYITASDGTLITHTGGALDVNISNASVVVSATDLDIRDLSASQDNVAISDGTDTLAVNADGSINTVFAPGAEIGITDGTDSLEVNADGSLNAVVTATDLDIRDLSAAQDNVAISDGTDTLAVNADGSLNITDNGASLTVDAVDFDIRDLSASQDNIAISDGTDTLGVYVEDAASAGGETGLMMFGIRQDAAGSPVSADGDFHPFVFNNDGELKVAADIRSEVADDAVDSGNPVKVGSRVVDDGIALSAVSAAGDRADMISDPYRRIYINDSPNIGAQSAAASVSTTAVELAATPLAGRRRIMIQNLGNRAIFIGGANTVTSSTGLEVSPASTLSLEVGEAVNLYAITSSGTQDVRVFELA